MDGCNIQLCTENKVIDTFNGKDDVQSCLDCMSLLDSSNLYFVGGVDPKKKKERASDKDILKKNCVYFDLDMRKAHPALTDAEIKATAKDFAELLSLSEEFKDWSFIVYTGNGLHIHYFFDPVPIKNPGAWREGMRGLVAKLSALLSEEVDGACINPARLARMPGSKNVKKLPGKPVEVLMHQKVMWRLGKEIEALGAKEYEKKSFERSQTEFKMKALYPEQNDTYKAIQQVKIVPLVCKIFNWQTDGRNFTDANGREHAPFVPEGENFVVHGGTKYLPASAIGFSPFEFVREALKIDNKQTFDYFRNNYPEIKALSLKEQQMKQVREAAGAIPSGDISAVFAALKNVNFEVLSIAPEWDAMRFIIRGAITRIGAYSNIGKSKLAYYFAHRLLKNGYRGVIVSTEVPSTIVLANMLTIQTGQHFWDIVEHRYVPEDEKMDLYRNLEIFDVNGTQNSLTSVEAVLLRSMEKAMQENGKPVDFLIVDFCQAMSPKKRGDSEYHLMSQYALEIQALAQRLNIAILDLSQISNEGVRDEFQKVGMIPFKGSGHLYSSADVGILLKRDSKTEEGSNIMHFEIRKHKYLPPINQELECDFKLGTFKLFGDQFDAPTILGALSPRSGGIF